MAFQNCSLINHYWILILNCNLNFSFGTYFTIINRITSEKVENPKHKYSKLDKKRKYFQLTHSCKILKMWLVKTIFFLHQSNETMSSRIINKYSLTKILCNKVEKRQSVKRVEDPIKNKTPINYGAHLNLLKPTETYS